MRAVNSTRGKDIAGNVLVADTLFARMKGLLGKRGLPRGEALLISPCMGIHTFGMRFPITVIFLDKRNRVIAVKDNLPPNRVTPVYLRAVHALELAADPLKTADAAVGDVIEFE
jgi:uncharacterized protein